MTNQFKPEHFQVSLKTPVGNLEATVSVPTQVIPISDLVPLLRSFGERAMKLEGEKQTSNGETISCQKGCAACCRMLVPVSPPEAFALQQAISLFPESQQTKIKDRIKDTQGKLHEVGLMGQLVQISEARKQLSDEDIEPINQAYYAQRLPCPFLENEVCSIYENRPSACRELLVTSPAELCQELAINPIKALPVHLRMGTISSLLWKDFAGGPARLIPLPLALDWAQRHQTENTPTWTGVQILENGMSHIWRFLNHNADDSPS